MMVGPLLSGFSIYIILSYLQVPYLITISISIIISVLIFGLTKYYYDVEGKNDSIFDGKEKYKKSSVGKIVFVVVYLICLIFSFASGPSNNIFTPWELLTASQITKLVAAIVLSTFLPGYAILSVIGLKHELKQLPKFLVAYIISVFITGFTGYCLAAIGFAISNSLMIFNGIYVTILVLFLLRNIIDKELIKSFRSNFSFLKILRHNSSKILVFVSLQAFVILS